MDGDERKRTGEATKRVSRESESRARKPSMARASARGAFVLFEGVDRCGKSTQASRLVTTLRARGVDAELWRYPDRTTAMGKMIDAYLMSKAEMTDGAIHLLFAANRWEKKELMERKLRDGVTLVCDRYSYSGVAFTAAKNVPGLDMEWCRAPEIGLPKPDTLLYMELSLDEAAKRGGFGQERYETTDIQRAVKQNFDAMKEDWWDVIDASRDMDAIHNEVVDIAMRAVDACKVGAPLRYFER